MLFTVIIPYFNKQRTIATALDSVLSQSYKNFEVILVDDGSEEAFEGLLARYRQKFFDLSIDFRFLKFPVNRGVSVARNSAWELAKGKYIAFLDADDAWHPQKLEICSWYLHDKFEGVGLVHHTDLHKDFGGSDTRHVLIEGQYELAKIPFALWLTRNQGETPSIVINRKIPLRFDESMRYSEDYDLWLRLAFLHGPFYRLSGPALTTLSRPPLSAGGLSANKVKMRLGEMRAFIKVCTSRQPLLFLLPPLLLWSLIKHLWSIVQKNKFIRNGYIRPR